MTDVGNVKWERAGWGERIKERRLGGGGERERERKRGNQTDRQIARERRRCRQTDTERQTETVSKLMLYAQSASTVISGWKRDRDRRI